MHKKFNEIYDRIERACDFSGRDPDDITLIAVTKNRSADEIKSLIDQSITHFGENRVQEALEKWPDIKSNEITLHMIGPLQSNKVKQAKDIFDALHSLDRVSLYKEMVKQDWRPQTFVQVNTGEEEQKSGILPKDLGGFLQDVDLDISGLMCLPPQDEPASLHFSLLKNLAQQHQLNNLSMGMSNDFEAAIKCGATHIRLGRILFDDL